LDIRVLATSNRDMEQEIARGRFREDLYYRLNVFPLLIPPLRERPDDIVPLARHFLSGHARRAGRQVWFSPEAESLLFRYRWPGNVRELENTAQRALILTPGDLISAGTLRLCLPHWQDGNDGRGSDSGDNGNSQESFVTTEALAASSSPENVARSLGMANFAASSAPVNPLSHLVNMRDFEREHILATLREMGGSRKKTVEKLGISERTLRYKLQQYREEGYEV
jgi:two-component system response regulator FlrC